MIRISLLAARPKKKERDRDYGDRRRQGGNLCNLLKYLCNISFQFKFDLFEDFIYYREQTTARLHSGRRGIL